MMSKLSEENSDLMSMQVNLHYWPEIFVGRVGLFVSIRLSAYRICFCRCSGNTSFCGK